MHEMKDELILAERLGRVEHLRLHRPAKANVLNAELMASLAEHLERLDGDDGVSVIVLSGQPKFFAAGADVAEMLDRGAADVVRERFLTGTWECVARVRKPVIAAVTGYATGGGCEIAQACDVIIAGESARFGQPELALGTIPGLGGTQRLPRLIGRIQAMDWCLRARIVTAREAYEAGLVTQVVADDDTIVHALAYAQEVAAHSLPTLIMLKEAVNRIFELPLTAGLDFEKRQFHATFALHDRREGMAAFLEKRRPVFRHA
jgi:enoyl-CoA hydratase/carnithine racemase